MIKGFGNNGEDGTEGVRYKNTFGTYSHGPVLPKNPQLADLLISLAVKISTAPAHLSRLMMNLKIRQERRL